MESVPETCLAYDEDLSALLDGELPAGRAAELRAHSAACPRCTAELEALRRANDRLRSALRAPVAAEDVRLARIKAQLQVRLAQEGPVRAQPIRQRQTQAPRRRARWIVAAGMGLAAAAALGLGLLFQARTPVQPGPSVPPPVAQIPAPPPPSPAPPEAARAATHAPEAVAELPVVKPVPPRPRAPAPPAPAGPAARPVPSAPTEVDLASADEEDIELATRLDALEDFEVIQKLDLLERLRKAEEGAGSG